MKYTRSKDGDERCNIIVRLRFTRNEMALIRRLANKEGYDWHKWLESVAALGVEGEMDRAEEIMSS